MCTGERSHAHTGRHPRAGTSMPAGKRASMQANRYARTHAARPPARPPTTHTPSRTYPPHKLRMQCAHTSNSPYRTDSSACPHQAAPTASESMRPLASTHPCKHVCTCKQAVAYSLVRPCQRTQQRRHPRLLAPAPTSAIVSTSMPGRVSHPNFNSSSPLPQPHPHRAPLPQVQVATHRAFPATRSEAPAKMAAQTGISTAEPFAVAATPATTTAAPAAMTAMPSTMTGTEASI